EEAGRERHRHRQAAPRPWLLRALDLLPAHRRGSADDRAYGDGVEGDARRVLRRDDPDRARSAGEPASDPRGAGDDVGAPARSDGGGEAAAPEVDAAYASVRMPLTPALSPSGGEGDERWALRAVTNPALPPFRGRGRWKGGPAGRYQRD